MNKNKKILILGSGFAGIQTAQTLQKLLRNSEYEIVLIGQQDVAIYHADLYEIATAYNEKMTDACLRELKDTVAIPLEKIFAAQNAKSKRVIFIKDKVLKILPQENAVELQINKKLDYDYLVLALGSVTNYYDIPGLKQFSYPFKTLQDSLAISCHLDTYFHTLWTPALKKNIHIVIGGGGVTGSEFACELIGFLNKICKKYQYPRSQVTMTIIEGGPYFGGKDEKISNIIIERFKKFGIQFFTNTRITKVEANMVYASTGNPAQTEITQPTQSTGMPMDMLIWTGGVMPNPLIRESFSNTAPNGSLTINEFLQNPDYPNIFAGGDNAFFPGEPMLATVAIEEAKIIARNLAAEIGNQIDSKKTEPKTKYEPKSHPMIIPLGGKYAIFKIHERIFKGFWCWILRRLADLRYAMSILPFFTAIRKWIHDTNIFVDND